MSITANPVTINSAAKNGTLGAQTGINNDEIIFPSDMTTNNSNVVSSPVFAGRLVTIRKGDVDEETRYMIADVTTTKVQVVEDWIDIPVSGDTYEVSYISVDVDTIGNNWKVLSKRVSDWVCATRFIVASTGFFALLDRHSLETNDNGSTTVADVIVNSGGRFFIGYPVGDANVGGGYIVATPGSDGELSLDVQSGGIIEWRDFLFTCVWTDETWWNGTCRLYNGQIYAASYNMDFYGSIIARNVIISGRGSANEFVYVDASTDWDGGAVVQLQDLRTPTTSGTETIELRNLSFIRMNKLIVVEQDKTWDIVNPVWSVDTASQNDIDFNSGTSNAVRELFSLALAVLDAAGSAISGAETYVFEGLLNDDLPTANEVATDANGLAESDVLKRVFTDNAGTSLTVASYGDHAVRIYEYGYQPIMIIFTADEGKVFPVTMLDDTALSAASAAAALSAVSGTPAISRHATGETDTRPMKVLAFDAGNGGTYAVGDTMLGGTSGADGTIVEILGSVSGTGYLVLENWDGTAFIDNETISNQTGGRTLSVTADTATFYQEYTWLVDCDSNSLQGMYDWLAAKMAADTPDAVFRKAIIWGGRDNLATQLLFSGADGFYTNRNTSRTEGVWVANRGTGTIDYMTSDAGTEFTPPATVNLSVKCVDADGIEITGVRVYIEDSTGTELMNELTLGTGLAEQPYTYTGDEAITIRARKSSSAPKYLPVEISGTIDSGGFSTTITMAADPVA